MVAVTVWQTFSVEHGGRLVPGSYAYFPNDKLVRVRTARGEKFAHLTGRAAWNVARLLLIELAEEGKA